MRKVSGSLYACMGPQAMSRPPSELSGGIIQLSVASSGTVKYSSSECTLQTLGLERVPAGRIGGHSAVRSADRESSSTESSKQPLHQDCIESVQN